MLSATSAEPNIYRTEMIFSQPNAPAAGNDSAHSMTARRFPPPWTVEETDACFIVRDHNGQALAYVYFEDEPGRRSAAFSPKTTPVCGFT